jgi:hypothetical protein
MPVGPEIRQQLLELVYGLLTDQEAVELRARIEADAELTQAYGEAMRAAGLFREAARRETPRIELQRPEKRAAIREVRISPAEPVRRHKVIRVRSAVSAQTQWVRWSNWTVGASAGVLLLVSLSGWLYQRGQLSEIAAEHLRLMLTGPARLQTGVANHYSVGTTSVTGLPVSAAIEFALYLPDGQPILEHKEKTDREGRLEITIPADKLPPEAAVATMAVRGTYRAKAESIDARLEIDRPQYGTQLDLDRPSYRPGEKVRFRSLTLSRFGLAADREFLLHAEILNPREAPLSGLALNVATRGGVGSGEFLLPSELSGGEYTLRVAGRDPSLPEARRQFLIRTDRSPQGKTEAALDTRRKPGATHVTFHAEGGDLVPGLENRVYFSTRDSEGKPVRTSGRIVDGQGQAVLLNVESGPDGLGAFSLIPTPGERYRLQLDRLQLQGPAGTEDFRLPELSPDRSVVLTTSLGVFEPGKPLEFNVRALEGGLPLVAAAWCRGVLVGQQPFVTQKNSNPVAIPLDDRASGVIRLALYDYRSEPPKTVAERLVYRRPLHRLNVHVTEHRRRYNPGEQVDLGLSVTDEEGKPVQAILGISVVDETATSPGGDKTGSMAARFLLAGEVEIEDAEAIDSYLSDDPNAAVALDRFLGTRKLRRIVTQTPEQLKQKSHDDDYSIARLTAPEHPEIPPAVFDNLAGLQSRYKDVLASYHIGRNPVLNTVIALSFFGGLGLLVFVGMLSLMNVPCGVRLWGPSIAVASVSLIVGIYLMDPEWGRPGSLGAVAFAEFHDPWAGVEPVVEAETAPADESREQGAGSREPAAPVLPALAKPTQAVAVTGKDQKGAVAEEELAAVRLAAEKKGETLAERRKDLSKSHDAEDVKDRQGRDAVKFGYSEMNRPQAASPANRHGEAFGGMSPAPTAAPAAVAKLRASPPAASSGGEAGRQNRIAGDLAGKILSAPEPARPESRQNAEAPRAMQSAGTAVAGPVTKSAALAPPGSVSRFEDGMLGGMGGGMGGGGIGGSTAAKPLSRFKASEAPASQARERLHEVEDVTQLKTRSQTQGVEKELPQVMEGAKQRALDESGGAKKDESSSLAAPVDQSPPVSDARRKAVASVELLKRKTTSLELAPSARGDRDSTGPLYWNPALPTDEQGRVQVRFRLSDSGSTFRVLVDAHARSGGRIGSVSEQIPSTPVGQRP